MEHFYIIVNPMRDAQLHLTKEIQRFIQESGGTCGYQANHVQESMSFDQRLIPDETECILVVGGDGTLLRAARDMAERTSH